MKNTISTLFLLTFLLTNPIFAQQPHATITTVGEAIVYAAPNEIVMSFTVITQDESIVKAKERNTAISKKAIKYLRKKRVSSEHIQTQYMSVYRVRKNIQKPFNVSQRFEICIQDISSYEEIVDGLLENGIENVQGPTFRNTEIKKYKDEARKKAIRNAKEKAELLAGELGQTISKAYEITEQTANNSNSSQGGYGTSEVELEANMDDNTSFAPGQMKVRAKVEVRFYLN